MQEVPVDFFEVFNIILMPVTIVIDASFILGILLFLFFLFRHYYYIFLVRKALDNNAYALKYTNILIDHVTPLTNQKKYRNEDISDLLMALTRQKNIMKRNSHWCINSFRDYIICFIDRIKTMIKNYNMQDMQDSFSTDLLLTVLSIMEVNFLLDAYSVTNYDRELYIKFDNDINEEDYHSIKLPEEWIEIIKSSYPGLMSDGWYDDLINDLHSIDQYVRGTLYFGDIHSIYISSVSYSQV